ncbi:MAG: SpoIVB peptidase S55 domain-containing protein [Thermoanaerobaculia bacterium]|nr:SpoIVB peptidase S55 domain-containing protein [Thermoanaerobaculia bacterium]
MKTTTPTTLALALLALAAAAPVTRAAPEPPRRPSMPVEEISRGQLGYGYTVFSGTEPQRFEMEVLGVMRSSQPGGDFVLARLSGQDLEKTGVAAGMSGSPVYIDDRLVGAVAFSWPYAEEAIAGITPIANMRAIGELPSGLPIAPRPSPRVQLDDLLQRTLPTDFATTEMARLAPPPAAGGQAASAVQWVASGFGPVTRGQLGNALGSPVGTLASGGRELPATIVDGGAVAGVLVLGDYQLAAVGTVTERHGDEVLAFGHSFLGLGPVAVPMAAAEVVNFMSSAYSSFKISNVGAHVGTFEQDHNWGIRGHVGTKTPLIPLLVRVEGVRPREFRTELADLEIYVSALVATVAAGAIESTSSSGGPQGVDLEMRIRMAGREDLVARQTFTGDRSPGLAINWATGLVNYLANNDFEKVTFTGFELVLRQELGHTGLTIEAARPARSQVRPGETLPVVLDQRGYRGELVRRTIEVPIPPDAPAGKLTLHIGDGASLDALRLSLEPVVPRNLDEALELLGSYLTSRQLGVLAAFPAPGLQVGGKSLTRLPGSIQSIWKSAGSAAPTRPLKSAVRLLSLSPTPVPLAGAVKIDVEVRRPEAQEPASAGGRNRFSVPDPREVGR